jgi:hypothetical protein
MYGGALHGFTHAHATREPVPGVAYDPKADSRSFSATRSFLAEIFAAGPGDSAKPARPVPLMLDDVAHP